MVAEVERLKAVFNVLDFTVRVRIFADTGEVDSFARVEFEDHWTVTLLLYTPFFESPAHRQAEILMHEMTHICHLEVDNFVGALIGDDEMLHRVYEDIQERFVERMERTYPLLV